MCSCGGTGCTNCRPRRPYRARWRKHRCFYRLRSRHHHPDGYTFICRRCEKEGLHAIKFMPVARFWGSGVAS